MARNRLNKKIFQIIKNHKNVSITEQAIRNEISKIRSNNPGLTINAAAHIFAQKRGFKIMRYLTNEDRQSLQNIHTSNQTTTQRAKTRKIKVRKVSDLFILAML